MSRPGLIVGLGGTGQWVLTWLKRDLMLSNGGQLPSNVRLLAIDTSTQLEAGVRMVGSRREEAAALGDVKLTKGEFVYVGGDARDLTLQVKEGENPHIGRWYHAQRWLDTLTSTSFTLDDGAGRIRQFGRLAVFKDILGQEADSRIWRALRVALDAVQQETTEQRKLEIMVVGSFAGGTGSGMFLDVALILRLMAQQKRLHHVLRGFFALPSVFTEAPDTDMKARTFAAWRELNRFMVINSDFPMPLIQYVQDSPTFRIRPDQRIFDACYLVDSKRGGTSIAAEPKYGVHPMVAEVLSAILDENAGAEYTQYISTNLAPEYARTPDIPLYSAIGAFTVQVPAHYRQEVTNHQYTEQVLLRLLGIEKPDTLKKAGSTAAARHLDIARPDANLEVGTGFPGRSRCRELLSTTSVTYGVETAKPTLFTGRIAEVVETARDKNQRAQLVDRMARAGGGMAQKGLSSLGWTGFFTNLGDDPQFQQLRDNVQAEVSYDLVKQYQRRDGEKSEDARNRFSNISEDVRKRYGGLTSKGDETHGTFGDRLSDCQDFHVSLFRRLVRLRLLEILMGHSDQDPIKSKSGKLGYAWDYFDGLVDVFEEFLGVLEEVKKQRETLKPQIKIQGLTIAAQKRMEQKAGDTFLWWELPGVKQSEIAYLQAQQRLVDLRREDLMHYYVVETAKQFKAICAEGRDAVRSWIWHLSSGDDPTQVPGIWSGLQARLKSVNDDHGFDTATPAVQMVMDTAAEDVAAEDVAAVLRRWTWVAGYVGSPARLMLEANIEPEAAGEQAVRLANPTTKVTPEQRLLVGQENQAALLGVAKQRYGTIVARTTVAEEIKAHYPLPAAFKTVVAPGAEPLIVKSTKASARRKSNLIRVMHSLNDPYFVGNDGLQGELRHDQSLPREKPDDIYRISVVNSENPFKLTLVRTDDLYPPEAYAAWKDCQDAYEQHLKQEGNPQDPVLMQNFPPEAAAVTIERQLLQTGESYRPLDARVVMLLGDKQALKQFLYLAVFRLIRQQSQERVHRWELAWEKSGRPQIFWLTRGWNPDEDTGKRPEPDIINAIHGYVVRGKTWQPGREDRIDYEFADRLIERLASAKGRDATKKLLEQNRDGGLVAYLKRMAYDPDVPDRVVRQDYVDLAAVLSIMINEEIEKLSQDRSSGWASATADEMPEVVWHSRLAKVVEQPERMTQFVYFGMLGLLTEQSDELGYRWQLTWTKGGREQVIWLTPTWNMQAAAKGQAQPDIIDALQGYVLRGRTFQPGRDDAVDHEYAALLVDRRRQEMTPQGELSMLRGNLSDNGLVGWLQTMAQDPDVPERIVRPDYADLARLLKGIMQERVAALSAPGPIKPAARGPFQVYKDEASAGPAQASSAPTVAPTSPWAAASKDEADAPSHASGDLPW